MIYTDWIKGGQQIKFETNVNITLTLKDVKKNQYVTVKPVLIVGTDIFAQKIQSFHAEADNASEQFSIKNNISENEVSYPKPFRLAYLIETNVTDVSYTINTFTVKTTATRKDVSCLNKKFNQKIIGFPNIKADYIGPFYANFDPTRDLFKCPDKFFSQK